MGLSAQDVKAARANKMSLLLPRKSKPGCKWAAMATTCPVFRWVVSGAKPLHGPSCPPTSSVL
eukprot:6990558-Pyramimonas_sp.AAC.1